MHKGKSRGAGLGEGVTGQGGSHCGGRESRNSREEPRSRRQGHSWEMTLQELPRQGTGTGQVPHPEPKSMSKFGDKVLKREIQVQRGHQGDPDLVRREGQDTDTQRDCVGGPREKMAKERGLRRSRSCPHPTPDSIPSAKTCISAVPVAWALAPSRGSPADQSRHQVPDSGDRLGTRPRDGHQPAVRHIIMTSPNTGNGEGI